MIGHIFATFLLKYILKQYFLTTATDVNTAQRRAEDCNTVSCSLKIIQTDKRFNGKFITVPITVSKIASLHAALSVHVTSSQSWVCRTSNMVHVQVQDMSVTVMNTESWYTRCNWIYSQ